MESRSQERAGSEAGERCAWKLCFALPLLLGACATTSPEKIAPSGPLGQIGPVPVSAFARFYVEAHKRVGKGLIVAVSPLMAGHARAGYAYDEPDPPLKVSCVWEGGELQSYSLESPDGQKAVDVDTGRVEQVFRVDRSLRVHPTYSWITRRDNVRKTFVAPLCSDSGRVALLMRSYTSSTVGDAAEEVMVVERREGRWVFSRLYRWLSACDWNWSTRALVAGSSCPSHSERCVELQATFEE